MQPDGSDARVLSRGEDSVVPVISPDGRWIYYYAAGAKARIMRMPADGGDGVPLTDLDVSPSDISPDGRQLLALTQGDLSTQGSHVILDAESGAIGARLDLPNADHAKWGRGADVVAYISDREGVTNLWERPISGGPSRQLTKFTTGRIFNFAYTPDRKHLFLARGSRTGDVVLIRDFQ